MKERSIFTSLLSELELELTDYQLEQFDKYYELLIEKNKVMNLTAITEYEEVIRKHFIDSLSIIKIFKTREQISVLDMGTGAGFPGIPLKIVFPNYNITLLDSLNKRVNFLNEVITELNLDNICAVHQRAEDFVKNSNIRESFDLVVSRAVAKLSSLSEYCLPYVKLNGIFISYKAGNIEEELLTSTKAISILGGKAVSEKSFYLPDSDIQRTLIMIKKVKQTPKQYPRGAGKPTKEPIQ
jgi:16S rRNA (guanine527-N7)-methyltransferase